MKAFILLWIGILYFPTLFGQPKEELTYPEAGKPMPDFVLRNIAYFPKREARLEDFKGKWLILDFWSRNCPSCVLSFPRMNIIQQEMGDKVQVMMVGIQDRQNYIQKIYGKFREREHLVMPCAFDSMIAQRFDIALAPHILVVDDKGIVQAVTYTIHPDEMRELLRGGHPELPKTYYRMNDSKDEVDSLIPFDERRPFLVRGNGGEDSIYLFRSILSQWDKNTQHASIPPTIDPRKLWGGRFQTIGERLVGLYELAYWGQVSYRGWNHGDTLHWGKYWPYPILEMGDTSLFNYSYKEGKNLYCYSLSLPPNSCSKEKVQMALQRDLETYFGYKVEMEVHDCPYWRLVAKPGAMEKLKSKGGPPSIGGIQYAGITVHNKPYGMILKWLDRYIPDYWENETGDPGNVDIDLDCIASQWEDLRRGLQKLGLDLIRGQKKMKVMVIKKCRQ